MHKLQLISIYVSLFVAANLLVATFGPAITPLNALFLISADIVIRDRLQYKYGFSTSVMCCVIAGGITIALQHDSGMIAVASMVSVILSGIASAISFRFKSGSFYSKSVPASVVAAAVDSIAFPLIAFGSVMPLITVAQFSAKTLGAMAILYTMRKIIK